VQPYLVDHAYVRRPRANHMRGDAPVVVEVLSVRAQEEVDGMWSDLDYPDWYEEDVYTLSDGCCSCCGHTCEEEEETVDLDTDIEDIMSALVCGHGEEHVDLDEDGQWACFHPDHYPRSALSGL